MYISCIYIVVSTCECGGVNVCHALRCAARKLSAPDYVSRRMGDQHRTINCNGLNELRRMKKQLHMWLTKVILYHFLLHIRTLLLELTSAGYQHLTH